MHALSLGLLPRQQKLPAGIDHVGIGTDFDHGSGIESFENEADAPNVTAELVKRGYTEADIRKIWGGNFLRVLRGVEAARKTEETAPLSGESCGVRSGAALRSC